MTAEIIPDILADEWRTDVPAVGRWVEDRDGRRRLVHSVRFALHIEQDARLLPLRWSWRYIDPPTRTQKGYYDGT